MNDAMNQNSASNNGTIIIGFALGAVVGAGLALLLAPENGKQTRERLAESAKRWSKRAGDSIDHARETAADLSSDAKSAIRAGKDAFLEDLGTRQSRSERRMAKAGDASAVVGPQFPPGGDMVR